jgi:hypothetical protein
MSDGRGPELIAVLRRAATLGYDPWRVAVALGIDPSRMPIEVSAAVEGAQESVRSEEG